MAASLGERGGPGGRPGRPAVGRFPCRNPLLVLQAAVRVSCGPRSEGDLRCTCLDQQHIRLTMDKHLLGLMWGLPASFALPSVAACRRALACMRTRLPQPQAPAVERRRFPRPAAAVSY